jgi:hypothetical protein
MPRNFEMVRSVTTLGHRGPGFWLRTVGITLLVFNAVALFWCLDPPGGTRQQLSDQMLQVHHQILATRGSAARVKTVASKVQLGYGEGRAFESKYFLPRRTSYQSVIAELQRMAQVSGLEARDSVNTEEPIEGSDDLTLLNVTANFDGTYPSLMRFLYEVDKSPMLLMLDSLGATPQQASGRVTAALRFQAIIQDNASTAMVKGAAQ